MLEEDTAFFDHLHSGMRVLADRGYRHCADLFRNQRRGIR